MGFVYLIEALETDRASWRFPEELAAQEAARERARQYAASRAA